MNARTDMIRVLNEASAALADLVRQMEERAGEAVETNSILADLVASMEGRHSIDLAALVAALKGMQAPAITVQPAPIQFMPVTPGVKVTTFDVTIPGRHGAEDQKMKIVRTERTEPHG